MKNKIFFLVVVMTFFYSPTTVFGQNDEKYLKIRDLLITEQYVKDENLRELFQKGDKNIQYLVKALDDENKNVRSNAQKIVRYLGNKEGMDALFSKYKANPDNFLFSGPVPIPIHEVDYAFIKIRCSNGSEKKCDLPMQYIFALSLDKSNKANIMLAEKVKPEEKFQTLSFNIDEDKVADSVLENIFFLGGEEKRISNIHLISYNEAKDKALFAVYVNGGPLAEEWYHVVIVKDKLNWKFFSVTELAIS